MLVLRSPAREQDVPTQIPSGSLAAIYLFFFVVGVLSIFRSLPFAFALGVSRRSYYAGTVLLAVSLAAVYGLALAVLQVIEQATGGWGVRPALLPGRLHPARAVVPHLAHLVRRAGPDVRLRHVVRADLPALEPARPARLRRRQVTVAVAGVVATSRRTRLAGHRPLLHHPQRGRADRPARRARGGAAGRRLRHHAPRHRLTRIGSSECSVEGDDLDLM